MAQSFEPLLTPENSIHPQSPSLAALLYMLALCFEISSPALYYQTFVLVIS
jgi:hypothetical protein